ncbi:YbaB/EbfC family nucleoid-associated protein [Microbispora bryophytorum]|uniref:YbaB/EbfC family nucleoid-associated protein n=1 Tax=Microbispora bryophytorum subsp. camponoti TaxID=1677852 RepID=A0ABR8L2K9_9ACTN|nr:YbaB/EbfC family nucleoid-associated protein [Microbispora camponoti]MBD3144192.1 YbaB/EbfC family nucleoid-associated protein [Microbispora camponoti]
MSLSFPGGSDLELLEQMIRQAEDVMRGLADVQAGIRQVTGEGEGADGLVRARADGRGEVTSVTLDPRVMRLDAAALSAEVTKAIRAAQDVAKERTDELVAAAQSRVSGLAAPLDETFVRYRFDQLAQELDAGADAFGPRSVNQHSADRHSGDQHSGDPDQDAERAAQIEAWLEDGQREIEAVTGHGRAADGRIKVVTTAYGQVREVVIEPRAMRLPSRTLAEELLLALRRAQQDAERQTRRMVGDALRELAPGESFGPDAVDEWFGGVLKPFERPD